MAVLAIGGIAALLLLTGQGDTAGVDGKGAQSGTGAPAAVAGYTYEESTDADLLAMTERTILAQNESVRADYPDMGDFYAGWSAHDVLDANGTYVCSIVVSSVNPAFFEEGLVTREGLLVQMAGLMATGGSDLTTETIAGQTVFVATAGDGTVGYALMHDDAFVLISTGQPGDQSTVWGFVDAFLATVTAGEVVPPAEPESAQAWAYLDELQSGDCFTWEDASATEVERVAVVPCTVTHDGEVFAILDLPQGDVAYPGDEAVAEAAEERCYSLFEAYLGISYEESEFDFLTLTPTQLGWTKYDDRQVTCVAGRATGESMSESVAGIGR